MNKSNEEHKFTSTGIKFWQHERQMMNYRAGDPNTVISTHIAPEGRCNLKCEYCSVTYRKTHNRIDFDKIKDYVVTLKKYGLKAAIITGGGEPTLYPQINELLHFLKHEQGLDIGMITNGTQSHRIEDWSVFSWVRVSLNLFREWEDKIWIPKDKCSDDCVVGGSFVYYDPAVHTPELFGRLSTLANKIGLNYMRVLPNCLLPQEDLIKQHGGLTEILEGLDNPIFFQQHKLHGTPQTEVCHQSFFRPYLSEANGGTVYPCDSVVLNDAVAEFSDRYAICPVEDVEKFITGEIKAKFKPCEDCKGCVFTDNVMMLDEWNRTGVKPDDIPDIDIFHKNFV